MMKFDTNAGDSIIIEILINDKKSQRTLKLWQNHSIIHLQNMLV